ncbi:MAG: chemotaxis-specific protein-glutamate methyltransferase CheB [Pseudobdellovibrionaceae bacterium]
MEESRDIVEKAVKEVSAIVSDLAGIQLGPKQFPMVENRLRTRLLKLGHGTFSEYLVYLKENADFEGQALLSLLTTHHTYFFREFSHFEFLLNQSLNRLVDKARARGDKKIRVWSAACSRGQEVYSLAMFFDFHLKEIAPEVTFEIWGTDVDPISVNHAKNAVYNNNELKKAPAMYVKNNWVKGSGTAEGFSKVKKHLKEHCQFQVANLLDLNAFLNGKTFDIIFCRNVFIYFNQQQITSCSQKFLSHLDQSGFLFVGVSETLNGTGLKVNTVYPSVYQHQAATVAPKSSATKSTVAVPTALMARKGPIEVLCVDDSGTILSILSKILNADKDFTVTATAKNGLEALELVKKKKFDIITLDLHMPEMDGVGFLEATRSMQRPPVVIVSSINRDDPSIAQKAIGFGAADYIEKPSLENISEAGDELKSKLKTVMALHEVKKNSGSVAKVSSPTLTPSLPPQKIKVLVVDDSTTIRKLLKRTLEQDPMIQVVAEAERPSEVEDLIKKHNPNVITLDIHMPEMDGVTLLKKIHPTYKIPTIMISSISKEEGPQVLQALEIGAVDYIQKPEASTLAQISVQIQERVKMAAQVQLRKGVQLKKKASSRLAGKSDKIVLVGSSTGGTEALRVVLESMPAQIPPIVIVQHIPPVFSAAFAKRLNDLCPFEVHEAIDGEEVLPNKVLVAPGGKQLSFRSSGEKLFIKITDDPPMNRHKPSVDFMYKSALDLGIPNVIGVILTGMGADGAKMMKKLRDSGSRTIAQNKETCVVFGMPREAIEAGGAEFIKPLEDIAETIMKLASEKAIKKTG